MSNVAFVPMRVQSTHLHDGHMSLLDRAFRDNDHVVVMLGVHPATHDEFDPLDYETRRCMIKSAYPQAYVIRLPNHEDDSVWSAKLDKHANECVKSFDDPVIRFYCGRGGFNSYYTGSHAVVEIPAIESVSGTEVRDQVEIIDSVEFRAGVIYAQKTRRANVYPVVDMALVRSHETDGKQVFMCKRPHGGWRFPGGFVDPGESLEEAAQREFVEETNIKADWEYVASVPIDDWRYKGRRDTIMTSLMVSDLGYSALDRYISLEEGFVEYRWIPVTAGWTDEYIHPPHSPLLRLLAGHYAKRLYTPAT